MPLRGAPDVPPSAAGIAGTRPGGRADILRAQQVGGRRALKGGSLEEDGGAKLAPLENPPAARVQPAAGRRLVPLRPTTAVGRLAKTRGGKQRPFRVFARSARVRGKAAQFSASPWALRATQKRPCLPECTFGTAPETLGQRHCARGAAADGMPYTRPLIHGRGAADFGRRPTGGGAGVAGAQPLVPFFGSFLGQARKELAVGRLPTYCAAR